jgi:hypothetical protein
MNEAPVSSLQDMFLSSRGQAVEIAGREIVQMDRIDLVGIVEVKIQFVGKEVFRDNAAVISIQKPGKILLTDGSAASAVQIWDEPGLPRVVIHVVESAGRQLEIYNKYRTRHSPDFVTEDDFTGNAGMIVTQMSSCRRRYECSNGPGQFSPTDLIFELRWKLMD